MLIDCSELMFDTGDDGSPFQLSMKVCCNCAISVCCINLCDRTALFLATVVYSQCAVEQDY